MQVQLRDGRQSDRALVLDSIISTYRQAPHAQGASNAVIASLIEPLLSHPHWRLTVACPEGEEDTILGFVLYGVGFRIPTVAWLQVRGPWRRHGIGKALAAHAVGAKFPPEVHTAFMVQRIGPGSPSLVDLAVLHGVSLRFRPYVPLQAALDVIPNGPPET